MYIMKGLLSIVKFKESGVIVNINGGGLIVFVVVVFLSVLKVLKEGNGKYGLILKIMSRVSLKLKNMKLGIFEYGVEVFLLILVFLKVDELIRVFNVFDVDKDGRVFIVEFRFVFMFFGGVILEEEFVDIMKEVDMDNDGFISLYEFIGFYKFGVWVLVIGDEVFLVFDLMKDVF